MPNPLLEPYEHPGKYEGELKLVEVLDGLDDADEELGDVETFNYYRLFLDLDADEENLGDLEGTKAAILETTSQGFVGATYYDTNEEAKAIWTQLEDEWIKQSEEEDS